jgi:hypothetical protein
VVESAGFTPFFHEIVTVDEATDENQPPAVTDVLWPGLTLGPLLFSRAGVRVSAGRRLLRKDLAESSTLYWAHRRRNRPAADLSHGWGGNSQWRTSFRRDYAIDGELHFNVDADPDRRDTMPELTSAQRVELLTHRCIVTTEPPLPENDLWPYDDTLRSPAGVSESGAWLLAPLGTRRLVLEPVEGGGVGMEGVLLGVEGPYPQSGGPGDLCLLRGETPASGLLVGGQEVGGLRGAGLSGRGAGGVDGGGQAGDDG